MARIGDPSCSDVLILFARGSGQTSTQPFDPKRLDPAFAGSGIRSGEEQTNAFFSTLKSKINPSLQVDYESLHNFEGKYNIYGYQAEDAASMLVRPNHRKDVPNAYYESVKDGTEELTWYLEDQMTSCPFQQVVVGGYSQGAEVVGDAMLKLQPQFRPRIAYVALYGDPKFNPAQSLVPPKTGWWTRGNAPLTTHGILDARRNYVADGVVNEGSWCQEGDVICDAGPLDINDPGNYLNDLLTRNNIHSNAYQDTWIPKSAPEIVQALKSRLPWIADNVGTNVFINKNDRLYKLDLAVVIDTAGSMSNSLQTIKNRVSGLTGELLSAYWQSRVAVVSYDTNSPNTYSRVETPFTDDSAAVRTALQNLTPRTTTDSGRAMYSGLMTAMNDLSWRHGAQKKIIVITDAQADNPSPDGWTEAQVGQRAFELDPAVLSLANVSCDDTWSCDQSINDAFQPLADGSNGSVNSVNLSFGDTGDLDLLLEDMSLQPVAAISGDQTGYVGTPLQLNGDGSYDPDAALTTYRWDCNNDGVWDYENTFPTAACTYSAPYSGLAVLQVVSEDGGSATATTPVTITYGQPASGAVTAMPTASLNYQDNGILLTWDNTYPEGTVVRVSDADGNLIGYAPADAQGVVLPALGSDMTGLLVAAGNNYGWSEDDILALDQDKLLAMTPPSDDANIFQIIAAASTNTPEPTNQTPTPLASTVQTPPTPIAIAAPAPVKPTGITAVLGDITGPPQTSSPALVPHTVATNSPATQPARNIPAWVVLLITAGLCSLLAIWYWRRRATASH